MKEPRTVVAVAGAVLGVLGAVLAVAWTPAAAIVAALGAVAAAAVAITGVTTPRTSPTVPPPEPAGSDTAASTTSAEQSAPVSASVLAGPTSPSAPATSNGSPSSPLLIDPVTGLFSEDYFGVAIEARVAAARRHLRPVGVVVLEVVNGLRQGAVRPAEPTEVANAVRETLREADTACRRTDGRFALLLEDTPENGAIWTVERIRRFMAEKDPTLTLWAGVACYPAHGFSSDSLIALADEALTNAREWQQDRIEVAVAE